MITRMQISNFKAFSDMQTIPLKPITIIFGPNSSGKSSVIHSLLLARHGVDTQSLDATYPSIAGKSVDLGGFRQYIHRRNVENRLQWVAGMNVSSLPSRLASDLAKADKLSVHITAGLPFRVSDKKSQLSIPEGSPFTQTVEYRIDGEPFLQLTRGAPQTDFRVARLNREHAIFEPILQAMLLSSRAQAALNEEDSKLLNELIDSIVPHLAFPGTSDFLPGADMDPDLLDSVSRPSLYDKNEDQFAKLGDLGRSVRLFLPRTLTRFHSGVHQALTGCLKSLSYLGPLRSVPPRHMAFAESGAFGHPAEGAAAWQELAANAEVRDKVNDWLSSEDRLKTPYQLKLLEFVSENELDEIILRVVEEGAVEGAMSAFDAHILDDESAVSGYASRDQAVHDHPPTESDEDRATMGRESMRDALESFCDYEEIKKRLHEEGVLRSGWRRPTDVTLVDMRKGTEVSHRDVGIGISQVLPVLVQAYASKQSLIAMEQPEIHLHPALQAELGDVFIESALGDNRNRFVLETHSEHLILRILRRIRETSANKNNSTPAITPDDIALLYVDPDGDGARIMDLRTDKRGRLMDRCPGGFFEEDFEELF
ncbi:AAA family ATPase [Verrucomicrobiota bacterium]